jgi:hypothetical protein
MAKVGRLVTDPHAGAYCRVTLEWLAQGAEPDSAAATPPWGLVQEAGTVSELRSRCVAPVAAGH